MSFDSPPERFPVVRLFWTCWLIYAVHWAPFMIREQFPAITLATRGTMNVERFVGWTPDIFRGPDGRAFINNNPGASLIGAVPLVIATPLLTAIERWNDALPSSVTHATAASGFAARAAVQARREWYFMAVAFLTAAGLMAPISAFSVAAIGWTLCSAGVGRWQAIGASVLYGFATPVFVRTGYLNHNLLVCHAGLLAGLLLWDPERRTLASWRAAVAGALGGFAVLCDYSGLMVLGGVGAYTWLRAGDRRAKRRERVRRIALYAAGAAPPLLTLAAYQWWAFGYAALPSQHFMPAIEATARGYRGMTWPTLELVRMNFFDSRFGLFAVCPLLAIGLAAPFVRMGRFRLPDRETAVILLFFGAFTVFCASNQYSTLQWTTGIRYLLPVVPGLLLLSLQTLQVIPAAVRTVILALSGLIAWVPAITQAAFTTVAWRPAELQLSWVRRMSEYGAVLHPVRMTVAVLVAASIVVALVWWPLVARALSFHLSTSHPLAVRQPRLHGTDDAPRR